MDLFGISWTVDESMGYGNGLRAYGTFRFTFGHTKFGKWVFEEGFVKEVVAVGEESSKK